MLLRQPERIHLVLELARSTWYYHSVRAVRSYEEKYADLRRPLEGIAQDHPGYG